VIESEDQRLLTEYDFKNGGAFHADPNYSSHHVRRSRNAAMAGFAREHAEAVRFAHRRGLDLPAGDGAHSDPELFARPIVVTNSDFRFVVAEQLHAQGRLEILEQNCDRLSC
jgi:hypothetical protein